MSSLSQEQRKRIEENKRKAIELRQKRESESKRPKLDSPAGNVINSAKPFNSNSTNNFNSNSSSTKPFSSNSTTPFNSSSTKPFNSNSTNSFNSNSIKSFNSNSNSTNLFSLNSTKQLNSNSDLKNPFNSNSKNPFNSSSNNSFNSTKPFSSSSTTGLNANSFKPSNSSSTSSPINNFYGGNGSTAPVKPNSGTNGFSSGPSPVTNSFKVNGCCTIISKDRFEIEAKYHQQMIEIFKKVPSREYNAELRKWSFHLKDHNELMKQLNQLRPDVCIAGIPESVIKCVMAYQNSSYSNIDLSNLDPALLESFFPFQREGVCWGISKGGRVLIADDMGLGKTIQALGIASYYRNEWPVLIVCPSSVRYSWAESVGRWLPSVMGDEISVLDSKNDPLDDSSVVICSYDLIGKKLQEFKDKRFRVIILDESHMIKSFKTARFKSIQPLLNQASRIIMLSGTPALSRPIELFTQVSSIKRNLFQSYQSYGIRYCAGKQTKFGWDFSGSSNSQELNVLLQSSIMIRRLKSEVLSQLPPKQRIITMLDPSSVKCSQKEFKEAAKKYDQAKGIKGEDENGALLKFFSETAHAKLKAVSDFVTDLLEADKKFIVFAHHKVMLDRICDTCEKNKTMFIKIDGSVSADHRNQLVEQFQTREEVKVAVLSIKSAYSGITLTAAQMVVFAEIFWNPGILEQAEDRAHRIGQKDCVIVQYLLAKGTSDDFIWALIKDKLQVLKKVGLSNDSLETDKKENQKSRTQTSILDFFEDEFATEMSLDNNNEEIKN